jgi:hypothetical protein
VGPRSEQNVELRFLAHVEGHTAAVVMFKNESSGEYVFYNLDFTAGPPAIQGQLTFDAPVRTLINQRVLLQNPLPTAVTLESACDNCQARPSYVHLCVSRSHLKSFNAVDLNMFELRANQVDNTHVKLVVLEALMSWGVQDQSSNYLFKACFQLGRKMRRGTRAKKTSRSICVGRGILIIEHVQAWQNGRDSL